MTFLYIVSLFVIANFLYGYFHYKNRSLLILIFTSLNAFLVSIINWIFFYDIYSEEILYLIFLFIFIISVTLFFRSNISLIESVKINKNKFSKIIIILIILSFLILSIQYPSDADSLDYHLGAPKFWLRSGEIINYEFWSHYRLFGIGEFINFFGLFLGNDNIGSIFQFLFFPGFCYLIFCQSIKIQNNYKYLLILYVFSCPLLISLVSTQKHMLYPYLILITCFFYVIHNKKWDSTTNFEIIFFLSALLFVLASKISFLPLVVFLYVLYIYNFYKKKLFKKIKIIFFLSIITFIFINLPFYLRNWVFYQDPISPFLEFLKVNKDEGLLKFAIYLQSYKSSFSNINEFFNRIVNLFFSLNFGNFTNILGLNFLIILFLFLKGPKINFKNKCLLITSILLVGITGQLSPRYYLFSGIILMYFYFKNLSINRQNQPVLNYITFAQIACILVSVNFLNLKFIKLDKKVFLSNFSYQFDQVTWLNNKEINEKIITDLRSIYYIDFQNINTSTLKWKDIKESQIYLKQIIDKNDVKYVSFTNERFNNYMFFLKKCKKIDEKKFQIKSRNPYNQKKKYIIRFIYELNERCLK